MNWSNYSITDGDLKIGIYTLIGIVCYDRTKSGNLIKRYWLNNTININGFDRNCQMDHLKY